MTSENKIKDYSTSPSEKSAPDFSRGGEFE